MLQRRIKQRKTSQAKPGQESLTKAAEKYIARFNTLGSSANKAALAWTIAFVGLFFGQLTFWNQTYQAYVEAKSALQVAMTERAVKNARESAVVITDNLLKISKPQSFQKLSRGDTPSDENAKDKKGGQTSSEDTDYTTIQKSAEIAKDRVKDKNILKVFGLELDIPPRLVPLVWSLFNLGVFVYLTVVRTEMMRLCCKAVRCLKQAGVSSDHLIDIMGGAPCWLSPLPSTNGTRVTARDAYVALGWNFTKRSTSFVSLLGFLCIFALQVFMLFLAYLYSQLYPKGLPQYLMFAPVFVITGLLALIGIHWFFGVPKRAVPDHIDNEAAPDALSRREFILGSISGLIFALTPAALETKVVRRLRYHQPRFLARHKKLVSTNLKSGFYINTHSHVIHYIAARQNARYIIGLAQNGGIPTLKSWNLLKTSQVSLKALLAPNASVGKTSASKSHSNKHFQPAHTLTANTSTSHSLSHTPQHAPQSAPQAANTQPDAIKSYTRVNLQYASRCLEEAALWRLKEKKYSEASDLLVEAIKHDLHYKAKTGRKPGYRLYDLLAGVSVRFAKELGKNNHFKEMLHLIETSQQNSHFEKRLAAWRDPRSNWHRKWSDRKNTITWALITTLPRSESAPASQKQTKKVDSPFIVEL